ncbi:SemiSWEET family sugar transporter [Mucilaginibacter sp. HD30]
MELIEIIGFTAGICTSAAAIPQVIKTVKTKQAKDISPVMFVIMLTGNCLWVYYGVDKSDLPIIVTNLITVVLDISMLVLKYKYGKSPS